MANSPITILHLSDIQFGLNHRFGRLGLPPPDDKFDTLLARLGKDLQMLETTKNLKPDLLVLSGDLTEWGKKTEFDDLLQFIEGLIKLLNLNRDRVIIIPGNHDVNRKACEAYFTDCEADDNKPEPPFWPKWRQYQQFFNDFYKKYPNITFNEKEPWTFFEIKDLRLVIAGLNSTIAESHRSGDHYGYIGESQLNWFAEKLDNYKQKKWLRIAVLHHNVRRGPVLDDEHLKDEGDFQRILGNYINLILHGHTHDGKYDVLRKTIPIISTGSAALKAESRPVEIPNQYVLVQIWSNSITIWARSFDSNNKRWIGDTRISENGDTWQRDERVDFEDVALVGSSLLPAQNDNIINSINCKDYWGEAVNVDNFCGREKELRKLKVMVLKRKCRMVALFGIGGIGKSALAYIFSKQHYNEFSYFMWLTLRNSPHPRDILKSIIKFISNQLESNLPDDVDYLIGKMIEYLAANRCLIIFDNIETILKMKDIYGNFIEKYEEYGRILEQIMLASHNSCIIITGREQPHVMFPLAVLKGVCLIQLEGITQNAKLGRRLLQNQLMGNDEDWKELMKIYMGNPQAIKLKYDVIKSNYDGNIKKFLEENKNTLGGWKIEELIREQFERQSDLERSIVRWLAIEREPVDIKGILQNINYPLKRNRLDTAILSLRNRRSFIERGNDKYTLQNVIMEYVTDRFVEEIYNEIIDTTKLIDQRFNIFNEHSLIKTQAAEYIRNSQIRLILEPLLKKLEYGLGSNNRLTELKSILSKIKSEYYQPGYIAGNIINLLIHMETDLSGYDFSGMHIWQVDFRSTKLHNVNFVDTKFKHSTFTESFSRIFSVAYNPLNPDIIAAGTENGEVRVWKTSTGQPELVYEDHTNIVWSVKFSEDGRFIASGGLDETVGLWDNNSKQFYPLTGHENQVRSVAFNPEGTLLVSGSGDHTIRIWDINRRECIKVLDNHTEFVTTVAFSPDGKTIASGSEDTKIIIWNLEIEKLEHGINIKVSDSRFIEKHTRSVRAVAFSPDGSKLASGGDNKTIYIWDVKNLNSYINFEGKGVASVCFSPDGSKLASCDYDNKIRLWDLRTGQLNRIFEGHTDWVRSVSFSPRGDHLASGSDDQTIRLWDIHTGECIKILRGYANPIYTITFKKNSYDLASGEASWGVQFWNINTGKSYKTLSESPRRIRSIAFNPDNRILACGSEDQEIHLWDIQKSIWLKSLSGHSHQIFAVAFSHKGDKLVSGASDCKILLWDQKVIWESNPEKRKPFLTLLGHKDRIRCVTFSPNDLFLASGGFDRTVRLWNITEQKCINILKGHSNTIWSTAFNYDGSIVASGSDDKTIRLWDFQSGKPISVLKEHSSGILSIAFKPDCYNILASGSDDKTLRLWDINAKKCIKILEAHRRPVRCVIFSSDGRFLASSSDDETIRVWDSHNDYNLYKELKTIHPYEGMNITGVTGLTREQKETLKLLGAIEDT